MTPDPEPKASKLVPFSDATSTATIDGTTFCATAAAVVDGSPVTTIWAGGAVGPEICSTTVSGRSNTPATASPPMVSAAPITPPRRATSRVGPFDRLPLRPGTVRGAAVMRSAGRMASPSP